MFSVDGFVEILNNYAYLAIPISLLVSIIVALLGIVPSFFVTGANIIFFGPVKGFLISLLGEVIGGVITFYLYRLGFKKKAENLSRYKMIGNIIQSKGKKAAMLIFEARLLPFVPSGFVTLAAAISEVSIVPYTVATILGKIPSIGLEAIVSYDLININDNFIRLFITIASIILIWFTMKKRK
ncbi:VTT domain-containing protein [uncultured Clostridium sp.]|uniref:TVP38/TMEM64 family protein n=1 Tax=uncultured Clostridium sp. TaxID=59620 RepID=UPI0026327CAE|nr:VTT domain-containing protein [uncultured Clostridium sp.]